MRRVLGVEIVDLGEHCDRGSAGHCRDYCAEEYNVVGVGGICHFFNASTSIHHRKPGILTEALLNKKGKKKPQGGDNQKGKR